MGSAPRPCWSLLSRNSTQRSTFCMHRHIYADSFLHTIRSVEQKGFALQFLAKHNTGKSCYRKWKACGQLRRSTGETLRQHGLKGNKGQHKSAGDLEAAASFSQCLFRDSNIWIVSVFQFKKNKRKRRDISKNVLTFQMFTQYGFTSVQNWNSKKEKKLHK